MVLADFFVCLALFFVKNLRCFLCLPLSISLSHSFAFKSVFLESSGRKNERKKSDFSTTITKSIECRAKYFSYFNGLAWLWMQSFSLFRSIYFNDFTFLKSYQCVVRVDDVEGETDVTNVQFFFSSLSPFLGLCVCVFFCAVFSDIFHNTVCHCHILAMHEKKENIYTHSHVQRHSLNIYWKDHFEIVVQRTFNQEAEGAVKKSERQQKKNEKNLNKRRKSVIVFIYVYRISTGFDVFTCQYVCFAGRPQPQVRWLVNGVLVDDQYEHNTGDVIENRLLWPAVQRSDLNAIFTCQAVNTILVEPKENSYVLDLHRKYTILFFLLLVSFNPHKTR